MIHNLLLIDKETGNVLAKNKFWDIEITDADIQEFLTTLNELADAIDELGDLPLHVGESKFFFKILDNLILVFCTDHTEDERSTSEKLNQALEILEETLEDYDIDYVIENFATLMKEVVITKLKVSLVGEGGVGKTTLLHLLLGDTPPQQYVPTIALNVERVEGIRFGTYELVLWDFAGQERFRSLWKFYFQGSDIIFLVTDSTLRNIIVTKEILKLIRRDAPKVPLFVIANKQDKPGAMKPEVIQRILGVQTYPMVAIDKKRRDEMLRLLLKAAAEYVGMKLPDKPLSELLRFEVPGAAPLEETKEEHEEESEKIEHKEPASETTKETHEEEHEETHEEEHEDKSTDDETSISEAKTIDIMESDDEKRLMESE